MNRDDIIRMAREAQLITEQGDCMYGDATDQMLAFAAMIAEDCAKRCESLFDMDDETCNEAETCAAAIRKAYRT